MIVMTRMSADKATRAYVERRLAEGRTKLDIIRIRSVTRPGRSSATCPGTKAAHSDGPGPIIGWRPIKGLSLERSAGPSL